MCIYKNICESIYSCMNNLDVIYSYVNTYVCRWRIMSKVFDVSTVGGRVAQVAQLVGGPTELARRADISQPTISRIIRGRDTGVSVILKIYSVLQQEGITLDWLLLGEPFKHTTGIRVKVFEEDQEAPIYFDETWFKAFISRHPERCCSFRAVEDGPKIRKDSWVIFDTSVIFGDGVYLIKMNEAVLIRRIQFKPTGELKICSHLDGFEDYVLKTDQKELINIIGRMAWSETH